MERFKVCEREMKIKAYSKEGLARLDVKEKAKSEIRNWISQTMDKLNSQIEIYEAEIENINGARKGKKLESGKSDRVQQLDGYNVRHQFHLNKLEAILRVLDSDSTDLDKVCASAA